MHSRTFAMGKRQPLRKMTDEEVALVRKENVKTIDGVRAITQLKRYKNINIIDPLTLLEMEV